MTRFPLDLALFRNGLKSGLGQEIVRLPTVDRPNLPNAGPSLPLARSWSGEARDSNARAGALKTRGVAGIVLRSEVSGCGPIRSEKDAGVENGGIPLQHSWCTA